jgi:hypothetical protein
MFIKVALAITRVSSALERATCEVPSVSFRDVDGGHYIDYISTY